MALAGILKRHNIGDAELGAACRPPIARTLIWCYRRGRKIPRADTAQAIIDALATRGVQVTLSDVIGPCRRKKQS